MSAGPPVRRDRRAPLSGGARLARRGADAARPLDDPGELFAVQGNRGLARLFLREPEDAGQHFCDALVVSVMLGIRPVRGSTRPSSGSPRSRHHAGGLGAPPASRGPPRHIKPGAASSTNTSSGHGWSTPSPRRATATVPSTGTPPNARRGAQRARRDRPGARTRPIRSRDNHDHGRRASLTAGRARSAQESQHAAKPAAPSVSIGPRLESRRVMLRRLRNPGTLASRHLLPDPAIASSGGTAGWSTRSPPTS